MFATNKLLFLILSALFISSTFASPVDVPNTFQTGEQAVAQEVNDNFTALETAVNDNDALIAALETLIANLQTALTAANSTIANLETELTTLQANTVLDLDGYLLLTTDANDIPTATFSAVNVNINNGQKVQTRLVSRVCTV